MYMITSGWWCIGPCVVTTTDLSIDLPLYHMIGFCFPPPPCLPRWTGILKERGKTDVRRVLCPRRAPFVLVADQPRERYELQTFYYGQIDGRSIRCIADRSFIDWPMPRGTSPRLHLRPHEMKHVQSARRMHAINWCRTTDGQTSIILIGRKGPRPVPEILPVDKGAHKRGWDKGNARLEIDGPNGRAGKWQDRTKSSRASTDFRPVLSFIQPFRLVVVYSPASSVVQTVEEPTESNMQLCEERRNFGLLSQNRTCFDSSRSTVICFIFILFFLSLLSPLTKEDFAFVAIRVLLRLCVQGNF